MSGFAYVIMHSSLCPEKLASDLINQDKQSIFSYSPSLEEGVQVLKYAFECLTSDSCSGCSCFPASSSGDNPCRGGEAEPRLLKGAGGPWEPSGAGRDGPQPG